MKTTGYENIGECKSEMLIADASVACSVVHVTMAQATKATTLKKGTVLGATAAGECAILSGAEGSAASYVLAEDTVLSTTGTVTAEAYETGKFVRNSLIVADGYTMTAADERALRDAGIFLENAMV